MPLETFRKENVTWEGYKVERLLLVLLTFPNGRSDTMQAWHNHSSESRSLVWFWSCLWVIPRQAAWLQFLHLLHWIARSFCMFHTVCMGTSQVQDSFRRLRGAVSASDGTIDNGTGSLMVGGANILSRWRQWQLGSFHLIKVVLEQTVASQGGSGYDTHHRKQAAW